MTAENFDADKYKDQLREQGMREDVLDEMTEKKKASLTKSENESDFEYVMKLEQVGIDSDHIVVAGFASAGNLDYDGEAINQDSLHAAWAEYMTNPVLRYMHGQDNRHPDAIGRVIPEYTTENGQTIKTEFRDGKPFIVAKISNAPDVEDIRVKIKEGVLKGFSIGGRAKRVSEFCTRVGKNINRIFVNRLNEISVVDLPANKNGIFEVVKGCVGNNCACDISDSLNEVINEDYDNYEGINEKIPEYEIETNKLENITMSENIEMEMGELTEFIKSTVTSMVADQEAVEKAEGYDAAIKEVTDLRARIAELETEVAAQAKALLAAKEETAMKSEEVVGEVVVEEVVEKTEVDVLKAEIAELKATPLYKAEQTVEKTEETVAPVSHLSDVLRAHYGGN